MARIDERSLLPFLMAALPNHPELIRDRAAREEWTTYGIDGGIWFDLLEPALVAEDCDLIGACMAVVEQLLAEGSELVAGAVRFRITPFLIPWERRWSHLMGPLLLEDLATAK